MAAIAPETPDSSTPILDRLAPLPQPARLSFLRVLLGLVIGILLGLILATMFWFSPALQRSLGIPFLHWLDDPSVGGQLLTFYLILIVVHFATISLHEAGHVLAGLATGFGFVSVRVGPLVLEKSLRISWYRGPGAWSTGLARMMAARRDNLRLRATAYVLGGPAANLLTGALALALLPTGSLGVKVFLAATALMFVTTLVPYRYRVGLSDGSRLWLLWRHRAPCERWLALMKLEAENQEGVLTQDRLTEYLAKAIAVRDASPDTVLAHSFAFSSALHHRRDGEAGDLLEICLRYSSSVPPVLRDALISDAVLFQAKRRKLADLAAQWLADLKSTSLPRLRCRAEAAVLEAQGDIAGALRKLDEYEAALLALPNQAQREMLLRALPEWRSELQAA